MNSYADEGSSIAVDTSRGASHAIQTFGMAGYKYWGCPQIRSLVLGFLMPNWYWCPQPTTYKEMAKRSRPGFAGKHNRGCVAQVKEGQRSRSSCGHGHFATTKPGYR